MGSIPTPGTRPIEGRVLNSILLDNHRRFLSFLESRVGDRALAEDILQDAFVKTLDKASALPDDEVIPWFYATLRNAVVDHHRRDQTRNRRLDDFARELKRERSAGDDLDREICACVTRIAGTLKPEYADALEQIEIAGASLKAYADDRGLTAGNAAVRVHRARRALKAKLAESCGLCAEHGCVDCTCGQG